MTDELENLRPEVRAALEVIAGEAICTCHEAYTSRGMKDPACNHDLAEYVATMRAELLRLAKVAADLTFAENAALQRANGRAERAEAELAALKARLFHGIVLDVDDLVRGHAGLPLEWRGKSVRLSVEE